MREAHPRERQVGMEYYASETAGIGGQLRGTPEDFRVREVEAIEPAPLDGEPGDYPHLLLRATLRSWDTNDFAARLSDALGVSRERVSWAGTKDKHAITTQLFSVRGVDPDAVPDVDDADVEVLGRLGRSLRFGDLAGNEFVVRVREVDVDADAASERLADVTEELHDVAGVESGAEASARESATVVGVPNYFGHQRFGSRRPVTHEVGLHVVRGEWREAVLAYCGSPAASEPERTREARAFVDEQAASADPDWAAAVEEMPGYLRYERSMLHRLADPDPPDDVGRFRHALEAVPSNLQRLFVNAAQSYAFNRIVSERLERGLSLSRPVEGDVVCFADRERSAAFSVPDPDREQRVTGRRVDVVSRHCARGRAFVTAPLVGTDTDLADGEPGEIERAVLADLDLEPADFELPGAFGSSGIRRAVLVRTALSVDTDPDPVFEFSLPKGSYATVLLREFLKTDPLAQ